MIVEAVVGVVLMLRTPVIANLLGLLLVLAEMAVVAGLIWRKSALIGWSIALLGATYGLSLLGQRQQIDALSLLVAAAVFVAAEVAYLGVEDNVYSGLPRRALASLAVLVGATLVSLLLVAIGNSVAVAGAALTAAGIIAALVLLGLLVTAATPHSKPDGPGDQELAPR